MSDIAPLSRSVSAASLGTPHVSSRPALRTAPAQRGADRVELSSVACQACQAEEPAVRQELVTRVRGEIATEMYETPERLDKALDALLRDLL